METDEAYYIPSRKNPSDLGTKFEKFNDAYLLLDEDSLFRNGPECLRKGIEAAVESKELTPLSKLTLDADEKKLAALEVIKLNQLVITRNDGEEIPHALNPGDSLDEATIEESVACLITSNSEAVSREPWLKTKTTGFRAQKATSTIKEKVSKVEKI